MYLNKIYFLLETMIFEQIDYELILIPKPMGVIYWYSDTQPVGVVHWYSDTQTKPMGVVHWYFDTQTNGVCSLVL